MSNTLHSQLPGRPSFRDSAMNAVAVVPITIARDYTDDNVGCVSNTNNFDTFTNSERSFHNLLYSLREFSHQGRMTHQRTSNLSHEQSAGDGNGGPAASSGGGLSNFTRKWSEEQSEITLILPHSQLTRPGDWRYDTTPLKSHDWQSGCQRIRIFDGRPEYSRMAYDRIGSVSEDGVPSEGICTTNSQSNHNDNATAWSDPWKEMEPHRATAAVIGILNMRDCRDTRDLWRAEESLVQWARRYSSPENREDIAVGAPDRGNVLTRMFVFDSFEESIQRRVNLSATRFHSSQLVAFPPLDLDGGHAHMMALHWNVVVNDLAVALFRMMERRIRENDAMGKTVWKLGVGVEGVGGAAAGVSALLSGNAGDIGSAGGKGGDDASRLSFVSAGDSVDGTNTTTSQITGISNASTPAGNNNNADDDAPRSMGVGGRFKNAFDMTRKAIASRQEPGGGPSKLPGGSVGPGGTIPGMSRLVTPLDLDAKDYGISDKTFSARDMEALKKRDLGRREKRSADLSLLAGSPIDAYERYTRAAELTRNSHDPLWYASALEGCACAFIAMAEAGGHGVDEYLENNFQLPEEIMALAIAQGVAAGADLGDGRGKTMTVDRTKTTLPQAVTALVEEALSVLCRHEKLAALHAGLLLKLADYVQEEEEGHLRCRWGEGEFCYGGDLNSMSGDYTPPRWERTSVSKLDLKGKEVSEMLALDSIERGRKFTELLHRAVSVGGLDDRSRSDVAATCARACLVGTKSTQWDISSGPSTPSRLRFPRKAAFFTLVAAEAMARCQGSDSGERASSLYLAASHLYTRKGNVFEHGNDGLTRYGWATLRASALQGLSSQQSDKTVAEAATELLIALLSEISPDQVGDSILLGQMHNEIDQSQLKQGSFDNDDVDTPEKTQRLIDDSMHGAKPASVSKPLASMAKTPFFAQAPPSALSLSQSKWLEDDPVPHIQLPYISTINMKSDMVASDKVFSDRASILSSSVSSMSCVPSKISFYQCAKVQNICLQNATEMRENMAASMDNGMGAFGIYNDGYSDDSALPPPLVVTSAKIIKAESHLLLERAKAVGYNSKFATHSMSTFFNPYAKNKGGKEKNKVQTTLVAEGEERTIMIEFKNRLAVPLEVPSCQLEFDGKGRERIEAPPLSFSVPAKTKSYAVHFPFIIAVSKPDESASKKTEENIDSSVEEPVENVPEPDMFDLVGLRVTCLNRTFTIAFRKSESDSSNSNAGVSGDRQLPPSASVYQRSKHTVPKEDEQQLVVRLESVPAQPNLLVSFAASQSPMEEDANVPVHLSDGEIFTIPPFRLENDFGKSGMGEIERLQVLAVGLPGIPEETLFDTDALAAALEEEEDVLTETDSEEEEEEDFEELMECDGLPPLKMKVIAEGLNLKSINDKSKNKGEGSIVTFQMAATHDMGDQLANGGNVRIRFRYRGPSPNPATEIWRKREISLRIIRVKGPRISSLTFRSDLSFGSAYSELCKSLSMQQSSLGSLSKYESNKNRHLIMSRSRSFNSYTDLNSEVLGSTDETEYSILNRVGKDQGVHVSADEVVLLMAVANETNSTIILSNRKGLVGGFEGSPMPTVRVTSGVSVKIPVVIPRIDRIDENGEVADIAAELVARTALQWESEAIEGADGTEKIRRTGRVRIPSRCLREIIDEHKSFASRICKPPVSLRVSIAENVAHSEVSVSLGSAVQVDAEFSFQDWVPPEIVSKCKVILEFCCAEKQHGNTSSNAGRMPYVWCGQLRRTINFNEEDKSHRARIAFFQCGVFVVSACVKVSSFDSSGTEETWWAPHAKIVRVGEN
mmetsp:Transcript_17281/g.35060  ORF Transcript_17281/g.35060 Transcript_17281/m.35060 type:complete len:1797 (-) Transcript_17281:136-5526(-)